MYTMQSESEIYRKNFEDEKMYVINNFAFDEKKNNFNVA